MTDASSRRADAHGTGTASGKVILFGEHAVVHGVAAIAGGISRGARATARLSPVDRLVIEGRPVDEGAELLTALRACRASLGAPFMEVNCELEIPAGAGLGASAALGISTARAISAALGRSPTEREVYLAAQAWEKVFHGNPSGVDVAAAMNSQLIKFTRTEDPSLLVVDAPLHLVVIQAGPPASTREMVEGVARIKERSPEGFARSLGAIASIVENALLLLQSGDHAGLGKLMDLNHMLLAGWMLSTEDIERACRIARDAGALGAKLTGAGGGGCVIALCGAHGTTEAAARSAAILNATSLAKIPSFSASIGARPMEGSPG